MPVITAFYAVFIERGDYFIAHIALEYGGEMEKHDFLARMSCVLECRARIKAEFYALNLARDEF